MRIRSLLLSMLVVAGFSACSDNVIDNGGNESGKTDATPAYLRISFSANSSGSSRSTADDANNKGDQDGDREDSGHHNAGTADETRINKVLVLAIPTDEGNVGFARVYTTETDGNLTGPQDDEAGDNDIFAITDTNSKTYVNQDAIKLATGKYNVLVVVNPIAELLTTLPTGSSTDVSIAKALYNKIVSGQFSYSVIEQDENNNVEENYTNVANYLGSDNKIGENAGFMMANKALSTEGSKQAYTVELKAENTPDNPAEATIEVERVLSKITYRSITEDVTLGDNVYTLTVKRPGTSITEEGYIEGDNNATYTFNQCLDAANNVVYGVWNQNGTFKGAYAKTGATNEGLPVFEELTACKESDYTDQTGVYVVEDKYLPNEENDQTPEKSLKVQSTDNNEEDAYYVQLEGYALVNLSKSVNYVRHTTDASGASQPFGTLSGTNFLWTPNWGYKNAVVFTSDGEFPTSVYDPDGTVDKPGEWFYNTLAAVSEESESLEIGGTKEEPSFTVNGQAAKYYKPFTTLGENGGNLTDDSTPHYGPAGSDNVGDLMGYCFENSTDIEHQTHGLSTGISFVARIYQKNATTGDLEAIKDLYLYNGNTFNSLAAISKAYGASHFVNPEGYTGDFDMAKLVAAEQQNTEITRADLEDNPFGIVKYQSNICYYYTTEIKHFDNGQASVLGNMEFAIMRNNIYSLSVTDITRIGDPYVDPTPSTPNESKEAALKLRVTMLPWIVRYHDIEF